MENKFENSNENTPRPDIKGIIAGLEEYNTYFNWGGVMGRGLNAAMANVEGSEEVKPVNEAEKQRNKFEQLKNRYREALEATGLSFEPIKSNSTIHGISGLSQEEVEKKVADFSQETGITREDLDNEDSYEFKKAEQFMSDLHKEASERVQIKEMRLNVSDSAKFLAFLASLQEVELSPDEKEALKSVATILEQQFIGQYDISDPNDDRFLTLIGSLGKIITAYENLGLADSVSKLKELLAATRAKYLKEYLLVERKGYLKPFDYGFGPAKWHTDMSPEHYRKHWSEAIGVYLETCKNLNATELSESLKKQLLGAVEIAKKDLQSRTEISDYQKKNYPEFLKTLEQVGLEL